MGWPAPSGPNHLVLFVSLLSRCLHSLHGHVRPRGSDSATPPQATTVPPSASQPPARGPPPPCLRPYLPVPAGEVPAVGDADNDNLRLLCAQREAFEHSLLPKSRRAARGIA